MTPSLHGQCSTTEPKKVDLPPRISAPSYRHASPSGPWPWMDLSFGSKPDAPQPASQCSHATEDDSKCWCRYPQSLFANWTAAQVERSRMKQIIAGSLPCVIHYVDVGRDGQFSDTKRDPAPEGESDEFWRRMQKERPPNIRLRALFVENLSGPVLEMLGTKYNIEPFFFSSSLNWIPSRYQEDLRPGQGDHITITLTFLRTFKESVKKPYSVLKNRATDPKPVKVNRRIDTQLPLPLRSDDEEREEDESLLLDLLAIHMVRTPEGGTIISYHPSHDRRDPAQPHTSAKSLHSRIGLAGQSVYWQNIFQKSDDPTFVLLTILWYALYAWDEALETLWEYISQLESNVTSTNNMPLTHELHEIRAHLLHYSSLLDDFRKSVRFVLNTPNPAMNSPRYDAKTRQLSRDLLKKECNNLLMEINRLSLSREMQDKRLKNVMNLVFSSVNIELMEAAMRDSAAMKQIAYLTMVFLPASFCAGLFGMNVKEISQDTYGTIPHYVVTAVPFTLVTIWIVLAFHGHWHGRQGEEVGIWTRLLWPFAALGRLIGAPATLDRMRDAATIWAIARRQSTMKAGAV